MSVLRALSMDPAVLPALDQAGTIQGTMALLLGVPMQRSLPVQLEVLHTIFNLCKLKSDRCVLPTVVFDIHTTWHTDMAYRHGIQTWHTNMADGSLSTNAILL